MLHPKDIQKRFLLAFTQASLQKYTQHPGCQLPAFSKSIPEAEASQTYWSHLPQPSSLTLTLRERSAFAGQQAWDLHRTWLKKKIKILKMFLLKVLDSSRRQPLSSQTPLQISPMPASQHQASAVLSLMDQRQPPTCVPRSYKNARGLSLQSEEDI